MNNSLIDLFEKLELSDSPASSFEIASLYFEQYGFDAINIGISSRSDSKFIGGFSTMCPDFIRHYIEENYPTIDPHLRYCREHAVERICDPVSNMRLEGAESDVVRTMLNEARDVGQASSVLIPRHSPSSDRTIIVNLVSSAEVEDMTPCFMDSRSEIMIGAALIQTALLETVEGDDFGRFWYPSSTGTVRLTPREREMLGWLADGARVDRIAEAVGISNAAVSFHIQGLKKKLGARTREQAVAMALRMRLL